MRFFEKLVLQLRILIQKIDDIEDIGFIGAHPHSRIPYQGIPFDHLVNSQTSYRKLPSSYLRIPFFREFHDLTFQVTAVDPYAGIFSSAMSEDAFAYNQ